jgi:hypothetical protein
MFNVKSKTFDIGDGRQITIETGQLLDKLMDQP